MLAAGDDSSDDVVDNNSVVAEDGDVAGAIINGDVDVDTVDNDDNDNRVG